MAYTQADIDALKQALSTGARVVRYSDRREVEYRSVAEIERILAVAQAEVDAANGTARRSRGIYPAIASGVV